MKTSRTTLAGILVITAAVLFGARFVVPTDTPSPFNIQPDPDTANGSDKVANPILHARVLEPPPEPASAFKDVTLHGFTHRSYGPLPPDAYAACLKDNRLSVDQSMKRLTDFQQSMNASNMDDLVKEAELTQLLMASRGRLHALENGSYLSFPADDKTTIHSTRDISFYHSRLSVERVVDNVPPGGPAGTRCPLPHKIIHVVHHPKGTELRESKDYVALIKKSKWTALLPKQIDLCDKFNVLPLAKRHAWFQAIKRPKMPKGIKRGERHSSPVWKAWEKALGLAQTTRAQYEVHRSILNMNKAERTLSPRRSR